jgi:hypothetical protein
MGGSFIDVPNNKRNNNKLLSAIQVLNKIFFIRDAIIYTILLRQ